MKIVVNEWLLDYLYPRATERQRDLAIQFVNAWVEKCDKVIIKRESPFTKKFYRYFKACETIPDLKRIFSKLYKLLFRNSDKTVIVDEGDINMLPEELEAKVPADDKYLIELLHNWPGVTLVTTDEKLKEKLKEERDIKICLLEQFMQSYLA